MKKTVIAFILSVFPGAIAFLYAQHPGNLIFTHLNTQNGLSNNNVGCITQDSSGFIWIATTDGLNRYDSRHFKIYRHDPLHKNSLPNNSVTRIVVEKNGLLWIGTHDGLCSLDPLTDSFIVYKNIPAKAGTLSDNFQVFPFIDHANDLWVATRAGLNYFNRGNKTFERYDLVPKEVHLKNPKTNEISQVREDRQGRIWCLGVYGLHLFNRQTKTFTFFPGPSHGAVFWDLLQVDNNNFLTAQWGGGFSQFNPEEKKFSPISITEGEKQVLKSNSVVLSLLNYPGEQNKYWVGTADEGLILYDLKNGQHKRFRQDIKRDYALLGRLIVYLFADKEKRIWVATEKGVNILDPQLQLFEIQRLGEAFFSEEPGSFGEISSFYETNDHYFPGVAYGKGLYCYDKSWQFLKQIPRLPPLSKTVRSGNIFSSIHEPGQSWYCTDSGLVKYDELDKKYEVFIPEEKNPVEKRHYEFRKVVPYTDDLFFVRTYNWGVYIFSKKEKRFLQHFSYREGDPSSLASNNVLDIVKNKQGGIYISTAKGLCMYQPAGNDFITFLPDPDASGSANFLLKMCGDEKGDLWIASVVGLFYFNTQTRQFTHFTTADGMASNACSRVVIDRQGIVWITQLGITRFDPATHQFLNFSYKEGLPATYFDGTLSLMNNGRILAGYEGGLVIIDPAKFPLNKNIPPVSIAEVKVEDKPFAFQYNFKGNKEIKLDHRQNTLNISFAVLNYTSPSGNKYYYMLEGSDKNWRQSPDGNIAYTNLAPGKYVLRVKGSNNSGIMNETGDQLNIIITPAFWQTTWFKIVVGSLLVTGCWLLVRRRIRSIRHEAAMKQQIAETEMMALRAQMNPHFIFNCLNSIDNLIQNDEKEKATTYLAKFAKLIRAILENSKNNTIPCWKDLETLRLYLELEEFRWDKKFSYNLNIAPEILQGDYKVPPMVIQPYVENAIHHGLLNKENGSKELVIEVNVERNCITYTVQDNGIGRKKAQEYKQLNKPAQQSMGMDITRDRINLFNQNSNGSVTITDLYDENKTATGTRVEVTLINQS